MITYKIQIVETAAGVQVLRQAPPGTASPAEVAVASHIKATLDDTTKALSRTQPIQLNPATRSLTPSVNDTWMFFAQSVYGQTSALQRLECKRAYMAGAFDMLTMMKAISDRYSEDEAVVHLGVIHKELEIFFNSITSQDNPKGN